jgi:Flp pilus assembly protein TadG
MARFTSERGQVLMFIALLLPVITAMAGMAVDIGSYAADRTQLQSAADAIALAAARELPDTSEAAAVASLWAEKNDIPQEAMSLEFFEQTGSNPNPRRSA